MTLTFDLLTSKSVGHILASWGVCIWSFMMIGVKGKQLCTGNPIAAGQTDGRTDGRTDRRTDGQTDMVIPVYPPNFVAGGIKITVWEFVDEIFWIQTQCILLLGEQVLTIFLCIKRVRLHWNSIVYDVQNATYSSHGAPCPARDLFPLLNTRVKVHISVWKIHEYPKRHS